MTLAPRSLNPRELALRAALLVAVAACAGADPSMPQLRNAASVELTISSAAPMASLGETRTLTAVVRDSSNEIISNAPVAWSSNSTGVVWVGPAIGLTSTATAVSNGEATITATSGLASATLGTSVAQQVAGVSVSPNPANVVLSATDSSAQLTATALDARGNAIPGNWNFTWASSSASTATVDQTGRVKGFAQGVTVLSASLAQGATTLTARTSGLVYRQGTSPATISNSSSSWLPATVTIPSGSMVVWQFTGGTHNVTFTPGSGLTDVPNSASGTVAARTFNTPGTYSFVCSRHEGMSGTVIVN